MSVIQSSTNATVPSRYGFAGRFDKICTKVRRVQAARTACVAALGLMVGLAVLAAADYLLELGWLVRAVGLGAVAVATLVLFIAQLLAAKRRWSRPNTAREIEERFPELGQSVRTAAQFAGREREAMTAQGVAPMLVAALEKETSVRTSPLDIEEVVPIGRLRSMAGLAAAALGAILCLVVLDWEWRIAARRALLADVPYTTLSVSPGDMVIDEGGTASLSAELKGRTVRRLVLFSRPLGDAQAPWSEREVLPDATESTAQASLRFPAHLAGLKQPTEYRFAAGATRSKAYRIDLRYPIAIQAVHVDLQPPAYTRLPATTVHDGNLQAVDGTRARFRIELDRRPAKADVVFEQPGYGRRNADVERVPASIEGTTLVVERELTTDRIWWVEAQSQDGARAAENRFRIRVRRDRPPQVSFDNPPETIEVHTLAEILMRARVRDDFGLSRAGIVFQINNEEEHTLMAEALAPSAKADQQAEGSAADSQPTADPEPSLLTQAVLERALPLEHFLLTQKDSVAYYAFVEDNFPGGVRRAETDLQFIDIRPFRQIYRELEGGGSLGIGGGRLLTLEDVIARQRSLLNRTLRLQRRPELAGQADLNVVDRLIDVQGRLATAVRELAQFLDASELDGADLIYQAETAMLAAVDSLAAGKHDNASLKQRDALRYLVEGRNRLEIALGQANAGLLSQLRQFDRRLVQKLRRNQEAREQAAELAALLMRLAGEEEAIVEALADLMRSEDDVVPQVAAARNDIESRQIGVVVDAEALNRLMETLEDLTDLARARMQEAIKTADEASAGLTRGDTPLASGLARKAAGQFRELARHVEGLLAGEPAAKIALARDVSADIAGRERQLADRVLAIVEQDSATRRGAPPDQAALVEESAQLAESGRTLADVLKSIAGSNYPADIEVAGKVQELLTDGEIVATVDRMERMDSAFSTGRPRELEMEIRDIADRMEITAHRLGKLYRSLVAPRVDELMRIERLAADLKQRLDELASETQITKWHQQADALLEEMQKSSFVAEASEELQEAMRRGGWGEIRLDRKWAWRRDGHGNDVAPGAYGRALDD
ncbi:MAG: DUF4175 family protein, partial [Pirellulales bacterium]